MLHLVKGGSMEQYTLQGSLTKASPSYQKIAEIQEFIAHSKDDDLLLLIDIDIKSKLSVSFLSYFSLLPFIAKRYNKNLVIQCSEKIIQMLKSSKFIKKKDICRAFNTDITTILTNNTQSLSKKEDVIEVVANIAQEAPVVMSEDLEELFVFVVGELFNNAMDHSEAKDIIAAKYLSIRKNVFSFSCYDTGIGIPSKIKTIYPHFDEKEALLWSLERGNSTVLNEPRGLGLDLLRDFANQNEGTLRIFSNSMIYIYDHRKGERCVSTKFSFQGTLCEMDIKADKNRKYALNYEVNYDNSK